MLGQFCVLPSRLGVGIFVFKTHMLWRFSFAALLLFWLFLGCLLNFTISSSGGEFRTIMGIMGDGKWYIFGLDTL